DDAPARVSKHWQERVDDGQRAEHIDLELAPDGSERQYLQRPRGGDARFVDQEIEPAIAERVGYSISPGLHGLFFADVANRQTDPSAGGVLQVLDLGCGHGRAENDVAFGGEPERDIAAESRSGTSDRGGSARIFGCACHRACPFKFEAKPRGRLRRTVPASAASPPRAALILSFPHAMPSLVGT